MPQTHPTASTTGQPPVPVAVLLPRTPPTSPATGAQPTWCGIDAFNAATLICAYSRLGDVVLTVGPEPMLAAAAQYLGRHPATLLTNGDRRWIRAAGRTRRLVHQRGTGTILATLPDPHVDTADLPATTHAVRAWRGLLRPGGYLLVALTALHACGSRVSPRSNLIA